jgi:hypothetical protein
MHHPTNRGERRAVREQQIARRKFIAKNIWRMYGREPHEGSPWYQQQSDWYEPFEWGRYAKFNLGCGSKLCHAAKYYGSKDKRRRSLKASASTAEFRRRDKVAGS